jgi:hypothetical protein
MKRVAALALLALVSCEARDTEDVPGALGAVRSAIVKGVESDASQNSVVLVMHYDALAKGGGAASGCSGTLLTPRLVLTARHCVADTDSGAACDSKGEPLAGGVVRSDHDPSKMYVFGGKERPSFFDGTAHPGIGQQILTTGAKTLCDNDIALVLLDRPVEGGIIAPIRLDAPVVKGEVVTVVGWGITENEPNPKTRRQRTGITVLDVGPADQVGPAEFRTSEGTCSGDSGGPALAPSGAVIGALSRGGNGTDAIGGEGCLGATNIFSSASAHADLIRDAYAKAGQEPWLEGKPNPTLAKVGDRCASDQDCQSNACHVASGTCLAYPGAPPPTSASDGGCGVAVAQKSQPSHTQIMVFAVAVLFACLRRKK